MCHHDVYWAMIHGNTGSDSAGLGRSASPSQSRTAIHARARVPARVCESRPARPGPARNSGRIQLARGLTAPPPAALPPGSDHRGRRRRRQWRRMQSECRTAGPFPLAAGCHPNHIRRPLPLQSFLMHPLTRYKPVPDSRAEDERQRRRRLRHRCKDGGSSGRAGGAPEAGADLERRCHSASGGSAGS